MNKKTVRDIDVKGKKVLVRCDFNVPLDENKNITDNRRIVAALPTIKYLIEQGKAYPCFCSQEELNQIREKQYMKSIEQYTGNILLVGISYDKKTKKHQCIIEEYMKK